MTDTEPTPNDDGTARESSENRATSDAAVTQTRHARSIEWARGMEDRMRITLHRNDGSEVDLTDDVSAIYQLIIRNHLEPQADDCQGIDANQGEPLRRLALVAGYQPVPEFWDDLCTCGHLGYSHDGHCYKRTCSCAKFEMGTA